jgi:lipoprotein-anchoring transpeptidase ErfK/SrfK
VTDDDLGRRLAEAFDAAARAAVSDRADPPAPRFLEPRARHRARLLAPLAAAAAVVAVVGSIVALQGGSNAAHAPIAGRSHGGTASSPSHHVASSAPIHVAGARVHIKVLNTGGATYGVGMPVVALFSKPFTNGKPLQDATKATVNGKPLSGAWYFEKSTYYKGYPIEAHWRPLDYWPAHVKVHVHVPARGLAAGNGMAFDDSVTVDFSTGPRNLAIVNDATHTMTVTSDGEKKWIFPVSLGAANTPTERGTKVIMEKGARVCLRGPGYDECDVKYTQRLTYGGEYLHAAPWNTYNIDHGIDSSNGCTNLLPKDAQLLYKFLNVGDLVEYPNTDGPTMQPAAGYGDWNVPWSVWRTGGLIPTS